MNITIKEMDMRWAEEFMQKLSEAKEVLSSFVHLAHNTITILTYLAKLKTHPAVESTTKMQFGLVCNFTSHNPESEDGHENHTLQVQAVATAPIMIQVLSLLAGEHLHNLKTVEQDTPELQEVLGAVSAFKDRALSLDLETGCVHCEGCGEDDDPMTN